MANLSDTVILPSRQAGETFDRFFPRLRDKSCVIPLPYTDEACNEKLERRYVSWVGHIGNPHQKGLDLFLEMVEENARRSGEPVFQLVTGEDPEQALKGLSQAARESLRVVHQDQLSDQTISRAIRASLAVVLLQRRVMQSGVLPMAYMNGTPVMVSDLEGFTQFMEEGRTGAVLPLNSSLEQRFEAIDLIRGAVEEMSPHCRRAYEKTFDSRCLEPHIPFILGQPESD